MRPKAALRSSFASGACPRTLTEVHIAERAHIAVPAAPVSAEPYWTRKGEAVYRWFARTCLDEGYDRVLDAGCGYGCGTAVLAAHGLDATGVDIDRLAIASAARTFRFGRSAYRVDDATSLPDDARSFDAVLAAAVFEQAPDPQAILAEALRVLRPGGMLVVSTVNRLTASPGRTRPLDGHHVWEFTPEELHSLMAWRFPSTRLLGVFHGRRLRAVERALGGSLPLTLARVAPPDRASWLRAVSRRVRATDFVVAPGAVRDALDLVAVAQAGA